MQVACHMNFVIDLPHRRGTQIFFFVPRSSQDEKYLSLKWIIFFLFLSLADCCRILLFREIYPDSAFNKSIINNLTVDGEVQCQLSCYLQTGCKSYNLGPVSEQGKRVCELSSSHYESQVSHLESRPGFIYRPSDVSLLLWVLGKRTIASREKTDFVFSDSSWIPISNLWHLIHVDILRVAQYFSEPSVGKRKN